MIVTILVLGGVAFVVSGQSGRRRMLELALVADCSRKMTELAVIVD